jgi:hypothetical protein
MKLALITSSFLIIGSNAYDRVGVERYCNVDPSEFTVQCNFESLGSCNAYLEAGQRCIANPSYLPTSIKSEALSKGPESDPIPAALLAAWQKDHANRITLSYKVMEVCDLVRTQLFKFVQKFEQISLSTIGRRPG